LATGDDFSGTLARETGENAGIYEITQGSLSLNSDYSIEFISDDFEITARPVTVTADASQTKVYGESDPDFTYSLTGTLESGDSFTGSLTRVTGENVGNYAIQQGSLSLGDNYDINFVGSNFEITVRAITVTADAGQFKVYGENDPEFTYTPSEALIGTDVFTGLLDRAFGDDAGFYAINQGSLTLNSNYDLSFVSNDFEIIKATPVIDWENPADIYYGTLLSSTQLNAFAGISGTYEYNPPAGTLLSDGNNQELNVTFTPSDGLNYNVAYKTVYINVLWPVEVDDVNINAMSFYPNPTKGIINFDGNKAENIRITDITGKVVFEKSEFVSGESIDLSVNPAGVYFVTIQTETKTYISKIIKQ